MNFLFPLYLLGAAAVIIPIVLHLRRRPPRDRMEFSSLMLLKPSPMERKRRRRLEDLLLLFLRCALICLLAFLFARPFMRGNLRAEGAGKGTWTVVLLDRSASMRREDLWEQAVAKAAAHARTAAPADRCALVLFDRHETVAAGFDEWKETPPAERAALWERKLGEAEAGWGETRLAQALAFAAELLDEEEQSERGDAAAFPEESRIILIGDLQEGSDLAALGTLAWPEKVALALEPVEARSADNASLHLLASESVLSLVEEGETAKEDAAPGANATAATAVAAADGREGAGPRVRVINERASGREEFTVGWEGDRAEDTGVVLGAGMQRTLRFQTWRGAETAAAAGPVLVLRGDAHAFDNRVYVSREARRPLRALYFGGGDTSESDTAQPFFYLKRAIQATNVHEPWVSHVIPEDLNLAETAHVVVVADAAGETEQAKIRSYLEGGGTVLFLLRSAAQGEMLGKLLGAGALKVEDAEPASRYVLLDEIDFEHPLLAAFSDPRVRDFSKVHFWKYRRLAGGASWPAGGEVVARFETGDPAWLSYAIGEGRLIVHTSAWHPADSELALSTKFVPLLYSVLERGEESRSDAQFVVGDPLPVGAAASVRRPDGKEESAGEGSAYYDRTDLPGIYVVKSGGEEQRFAVNLAASESRTLPLAAERFEEAGITVARGAGAAGKAGGEAGEEREQQLLDVEKEKRQQLWRWLVLGAIGVVFMEMILAGRGRLRARERAQPAPGEAVSSEEAT